MADTETNEAKISIKLHDIALRNNCQTLGETCGYKALSPRELEQSVPKSKDFPECYFATEECKCMLLNPRSLLYDHCRKLKLKLDDTEPSKYFECPSCPIRITKTLRSYEYFIELTKDSVSTCNKAKCVKCGTLMTSESVYMGLPFQENGCGGDGLFVSDIATYIVTDDLYVMPYSSATCIRLLTYHGITDKSCLEDIKLDFGREQMLYFLKVALSLDSVFTYLVFHRTRSVVVPDQNSTLDQTDTIMMKEESPGSNILLEVSLQKSTGKGFLL
ncbi:uncharacterized protein LOC143533133 [Bidens hawaiensis]|uniref:uncharacterized protein LOC143533133 n=1 Tax=Bidens hawaiensis TaxID=980011 RepID=UPI0040497B1C